MARALSRAPARLAVALGFVLACLVVCPDAPADARAGQPTTLFTLHDPRLTELSGIARGIASPGVYWVHNDSGDSARVFALDATTGAVRAEYRVPGADNVDWEDLAVARDASGTPSLWLADIGDNNAQRDHVTVYRVDEPVVRTTTVPSATARPDSWQLRYPHGPVNAESLAVSPGGRAYVITKSDNGHSAMFAVPAAPSAALRTMREVARIDLPALASLVPARLQRDATGAAISRDGKVFALRTYTDAYVWPVRDGNVPAAVRSTPTHVALPLQPQGEGVCIDGARLVLDSEQRGSAVIAVPLPAAARPSPAATTTTTTSAAPPASSTVAAPATRPPPSTTASTSAVERDGTPPLVLRIALAAAAACGVVALIARRRSRRQG